MAINALIGLMGRPVQQVDTTTPRLQNAHATLYEEQAARAAQQQAEEQATMQALGQAMGSPGGMSPENVAKIAKVNPKAAMAIQGIASKQQADQLAAQKATREEQSAALDVKGKEFDLQEKKRARISNRLSSINSPETYRMQIYGAMADGDIPEAMGQKFLEADYNDPQTQAVIKSMIGEAQTALQKAEEQRKAAAEGRAVAGEERAVDEAARKAEEFAVTLPGKAADAKMAQLKAEGKAPIQPVEAERLKLDAARAEQDKVEAANLERHRRVMEARQSQLASAIQQTGISQQQSGRVMQIASQFDNEPIVKNYNVIAEAKQFVDSLGTGKTGNAGDDQALLYSFAKAMDPGSVVREGEYATVQKYSQSWADNLGFKVQRIFSNEPFLTEQARAQMKATIKKRAEAAENTYKNVANEYGRRIEVQAGVPDGRRYITDYGKAFENAPPPGPVKPPVGAAPGAPKVGTMRGGYVFTGGDPSKESSWKKAQ